MKKQCRASIVKRFNHTIKTLVYKLFIKNINRQFIDDLNIIANRWNNFITDPVKLNQKISTYKVQPTTSSNWARYCKVEGFLCDIHFFNSFYNIREGHHTIYKEYAYVSKEELNYQYKTEEDLVKKTGQNNDGKFRNEPKQKLPQGKRLQYWLCIPNTQSKNIN